MERCDSCGSWTEECECPIPPWRMKEYEAAELGLCVRCGFDALDCRCDQISDDAKE